MTCRKKPAGHLFLSDSGGNDTAGLILLMKSLRFIGMMDLNNCAKGAKNDTDLV